ncbi:uncharacterized protein LOC121862619 [Homarus americanus]|uniref:uncharacterized protein LOC121862619 n=1 Tax=Homarus americanus TaxID=6706 RepID=UPI001C467B3C|nr:uncharacterized protein LOC121862619 [Homarus americanus]
MDAKELDQLLEGQLSCVKKLSDTTALVGHHEPLPKEAQLANLKIYTDATSTSDVPHDLEHSTIPDRPCDTIEDKPQQPNRPKRELEETSDTTEYVSKKPKSTSMFSPLSSNARKNLAVALGLTSTKSIYFGRPSELSEPRRTYKTKADGNCYFRSISYIITGSEESHGIIRDRVVQHMNTDITTKLQHYLNQNVNDYVTASGISLDGVWATDA